MTDGEWKAAAGHVLKIMGDGSPDARRLAEEVLTEHSMMPLMNERCDASEKSPEKAKSDVSAARKAVAAKLKKMAGN